MNIWTYWVINFIQSSGKFFAKIYDKSKFARFCSWRSWSEETFHQIHLYNSDSPSKSKKKQKLDVSAEVLTWTCSNCGRLSLKCFKTKPSLFSVLHENKLYLRQSIESVAKVMIDCFSWSISVVFSWRQKQLFRKDCWKVEPRTKQRVCIKSSLWAVRISFSVVILWKKENFSMGELKIIAALLAVLLAAISTSVAQDEAWASWI